MALTRDSKQNGGGSHFDQTAKQNGAEGRDVKQNGGGSHFDKTAKQNGAELRTFILLTSFTCRTDMS